MEKKAKLHGVDFLLPSDQVVAANLEEPLPTAVVPLTLTCCTSPLEVCKGHMRLYAHSLQAASVTTDLSIVPLINISGTGGQWMPCLVILNQRLLHTVLPAVHVNQERLPACLHMQTAVVVDSTKAYVVIM